MNIQLTRIDTGAMEQVEVPFPLLLTKADGQTLKRWTALPSSADWADALQSWAYRNGYEVPEAIEEATTNVKQHTAHSKKGKVFVVRQHERKVRASGKAKRLLRDYDLRYQDLTRAFRLDRDDYYVSSLDVELDEEEEAAEEDDDEELDLINVSGDIFDKDGRSVGSFERIFDLDNEIVSHESFFVDPKHQGKGIATDLNAHAFAQYRKLGFQAVTTYADGERDGGVGRYAWAVQGFDFPTPKILEENKALFKEYLSLKDSQTQHKYGEADLPNIISAVNSMKHSWEMAAFTVNDDKVGKHYMLKYVPNWHGVMKLDPNSDSIKVFNTYKDKVNAKKGKVTEAIAEATVRSRNNQDSVGFHIELLRNENAILAALRKAGLVPPAIVTKTLKEATQRVRAYSTLLEKLQQVKAYQKNLKGKLVNVRTYARDVDVSSIDKGPRIFRGEPVKSEKISKSRTGKIGEAITLHQKGGMPVNVFLDRKENNLAFDVINLRKRKLYEVKAGLISVGLKAKSKYDGMKWRLTKGEPSKYEKKLLKKMNAEVKFKHNKNKEDAIIQRKLALKADLEKKTGVKFTVKTITYIVNPTTKQADMYEFDGLHKEIRWRSDQAAAGYKRSVKWK